MWRAARARGHASPDWTGAGRAAGCRLDDDGYRAFRRDRRSAAPDRPRRRPTTGGPCRTAPGRPASAHSVAPPQGPGTSPGASFGSSAAHSGQLECDNPIGGNGQQVGIGGLLPGRSHLLLAYVARVSDVTCCRALQRMVPGVLPRVGRGCGCGRSWFCPCSGRWWCPGFRTTVQPNWWIRRLSHDLPRPSRR